ncbi:hypothetical protein DSL72_003258 [Monilinia vaccinii-corymbosi]|uniref:BTB domain-containing protein n=1 Tax=Monilinia vaccinii-corymbosi TaxID=61207 RepID=A0A8A3NTG6_9HELO|nr:hypothetical protein DSL72_003258 [Monilinia vaccinii-corymbosi]
MAILPLFNRPQVQSITNALKNICRDYPAGGAVLRELLQNADDAGASTVKFVLDDNFYETEPLLHPELAQYQGPALLAFNSAKFLDKDFESLSRVGDSLKFSDGATTGRFGRGFNSVRRIYASRFSITDFMQVYNWTDSPSIVSRDRLLILDPHHVCSSGGEIYDFVANAGEREITNQMSVFQKLLQPLDQPLDGTIIRIPMRTDVQARTSQISDRQITVSEMSTVLERFADEFSNGGLVFMKHVSKISIYSNIAGNIDIEVCNFEEVLLHKNMINNAIINSLNDTSYIFNRTFELKTRYRSRRGITETSFMVSHNIDSRSMSQEILEWSRNQKFAPWVAIAIKLSGGSDSVRTGALFTVMPLQIPIDQPAFIHGMFSISPDRARLYKAQDSSSQDEVPAKWNEWLFNESIPHAWAKLLCDLASLFPVTSSWEHWPHRVNATNCFSKDVLAKVLSLIQRCNLPLFHTHMGYVTAADGLLATGSESEELQQALFAAKIPVIFVPDPLKSELNDMFENSKLEPKTLCQFLDHKNQWVVTWNGDTRQAILEYILFILVSSDYGKTLELLPFEDGQRRSLNAHTAFVHRNDFEAELFRRDTEHNLDISRFSLTAAEALKDSLLKSQDHKHICYRSAKDLKSYALTYEFWQFDQKSDMVVLNLDQVAFVTKVWSWISSPKLDIFNEHFGTLWLLPVTNGRYRKVKPVECWALFPPFGRIGDIVRKLGEPDDFTLNEPVLLTSTVGLEQASLSLLKTIKAGATLQIHNGEKVHSLLAWLGHSNVTIENASDEDKTDIIEYIAKELGNQSDLKYENENVLNLQKLPIFRGLTWENDRDSWFPATEWVRIEAFKSIVGVIDGVIPLPTFKEIQFLDAQTTHIQKILVYGKLGVCKSKIELVEDHIVPAWRGVQRCSWPPSSKAQTAELMFRSYHDLSAQAQAGMASLPIIPTQCIDGSLAKKYSTASTLIDPGIAWLKGVFFGDEEVLPAEEQYERYGSIFKKFGLRTNLDESFVYERARKLVNTSRPYEEIHVRALNLLKTSCTWSVSKGTATKHKQFLNLKWLPASLPDGSTAMVSPSQCRGMEDVLHAGHRLPIVSLTVSRRWKEFLGWDEILHDDILLAQLKQGITKDDGVVVNAVLDYFRDNHRIRAVSESLKDLRCVLTDKGTFVTASKAFLSGCTSLAPFLGNVDKGFAKNHADILKAMNMGSKPGVKDVLAVQAQIEQSDHPYRDSDIKVLLETITIASRFTRTSLRGLKVLDQDGILCPVEDIAYDDAALLSDRIVNKVRFTNSRISKQTAEKLSIEPISERLKKGELELADDDDDDEDFQQCEAITTSISTTLDRYPIESTFKEYLANADDAKALAVHWMLDPRQHSAENLLTEEMKDLQGPALLVHNDAVFRDADFNGFKNVGLGSKREDKSTIGMFGRGSQTMFHFTDNPSLLSGDYLLILDPLQKYLPFNSNWQARKPGVKILLSKLKQLHPNQLAPFQNLWGYDVDSDHYDGTIFRFPLRKQASPLREKQAQPSIDSVHFLMNQYFKEARISLLFLKEVKTITFKGPAAKELFWSVKKRNSKSDYTAISAKKMVDLDLMITEDKWWVYSKMEETPSGEYQSRLRKNLEYGIAALVISKDKKGADVQDIPMPRIFSTLPLPEPSNMPVHIHATFSLSGDRNTLITGGESSEAGGSNWNAWLLEEKLVDAYLIFLEGLTKEIGSDVFRFWPRRYPTKESRLELLRKSFWEKLPNSSARLFPRRVANTDETNMSISEAVFDFLQPNLSTQIATVLQSLEPNLPSRLLSHISCQIESMDVAKSINSSSLRELLKSKRASEFLQKAMVNEPLLIGNVLNQVIPAGEVSTDEWYQLNGCRVLPLADGTLGQLTRIQSPMPRNTRVYYVVTKSELELFDFAKSLLILKPQNDSCERIGEVVKNEKFNVKNLELSHIPELLSMKSPGSRVVNEETDKWLKTFWDYWNQPSLSATENLSGKPESFRSLPLLKAICNNTWGYYNMSELANLPAIIDPAELSHKSLCGCIPGLYIFRPELMPNLTANAEESLDNEKAFGRFINALRILGPDNISAGKLVTKLATQQPAIKSNRCDLIKLLRELVIDHVIIGHKSALEYLKLLPIWPAYLSSSPALKCIPAKSAKYTKQPQLLAPWSKKLPDFIDFKALDSSRAESCLNMMSVTPVTTEDLIRTFEARDFPSTLKAIGEGAYVQFISTLAGIVSMEEQGSSLLKTLSSLTLAADMIGNMHQSHELFDHDDEIFKAAFQESKEHFLHKCVKVKEYDTLWLKIGLRRRETNGGFKIQDYMECLQSLNLMIQSSDYSTLVDPTSTTYKRMEKILSPFITPSSATHLFDLHDWEDLAKKPVFLIRKNNSREPSYRRENMDRVSECGTAIPLAEVVLHKHAALCWSNTRFVVMEPTFEILTKVESTGEPFMMEVWKHLEHMVEISNKILRTDISEFLADLYEIYDYLQNKVILSKEYFGSSASSLNRTNLWLNLDISDPKMVILEDLKASWKPLQHLLLTSSTDAPPLECIRSSLSPYEKLLRELGCKSIYHPTVELPASQSAQSLLSGLRTNRNEKKMTDIIFVVDRIHFHAHRIVMAIASGYCAISFSGRWPIGQEVHLDTMNAHSLRILIDTAYEEPIDWADMTVDPDESPQDLEANDKKLDLLLDLHKGADYFLMPSFANQVERKIIEQAKFFVRLDNVSDYQRIARDSNAKGFEEFCKRFREENAMALEGWENAIVSQAIEA